jgi:hypothetical protein
MLKHRLMSDDYQRIELITGTVPGGIGRPNRSCRSSRRVSSLGRAYRRPPAGAALRPTCCIVGAG